MSNLFVDPYLFACPSLDASKEDFELYISSILEWQPLKTSSLFGTFVLSETISILYNSNNYPLWDDLARLINKYAIDYIQPKDIVNIVDAYLQKFNSIQEYLNMSDYLSISTTIHPILSNRPKIYLEKFIDLLTYCSLNCYLKSEQPNNQTIVTSPITFNEINIKCQIELIQFLDATIFESPIPLDFNFKTVFKYTNFCDALDYHQLWKKSATKDDYLETLRIFLISYLKKAGMDLTKVDTNHINVLNEFLNNISDYNFKTDNLRSSMLLRSLAETCLNLNLKDTHQLREGKGSEEKQVTQKGYLAWRRDINHEFHLHYWQFQNKILFADIVTHNEFRISNINF